MDISIRNASLKDLDQIMEVELSWPEGERAPREKFIARLEKFPRGFFAAESDGRIVATLTSCPLRYEQAEVGLLRNWDVVTNCGFLHDEGSHPSGVIRVGRDISRGTNPGRDLLGQ